MNRYSSLNLAFQPKKYVCSNSPPDGECPPANLDNSGGTRRPSIDSDSSAESMEAKMADLLLAEEAEEARETPEPQSAKSEIAENIKLASTTTTATTTTTTTTSSISIGDDNELKEEQNSLISKPDELDALKATPPTPMPTVKINGPISKSNAAEKSPVDAISTWSEEGCHVFMPNWGETSSTNVSLLG